MFEVYVLHPVLPPWDGCASKMTYIVSGGALNYTHSLTPGTVNVQIFCKALLNVAGNMLTGG